MSGEFGEPSVVRTFAGHLQSPERSRRALVPQTRQFGQPRCGAGRLRAVGISFPACWIKRFFGGRPDASETQRSPTQFWIAVPSPPRSVLIASHIGLWCYVDFADLAQWVGFCQHVALPQRKHLRHLRTDGIQAEQSNAGSRRIGKLVNGLSFSQPLSCSDRLTFLNR